MGIAAYNLRRFPEQRTAPHVWMWVNRGFIGVLWWQQSLWKLPPTYTDNPDGVSGGLHHWVGEMAVTYGRKELGKRWLFHDSFEYGYRYDAHNSISLYYEHISNAELLALGGAYARLAGLQRAES